jgi:hypothetical protein
MGLGLVDWVESPVCLRSISGTLNRWSGVTGSIVMVGRDIPRVIADLEALVPRP